MWSEGRTPKTAAALAVTWPDAADAGPPSQPGSPLNAGSSTDAQSPRRRSDRATPVASPCPTCPPRRPGAWAQRVAHHHPGRRRHLRPPHGRRAVDPPRPRAGRAGPFGGTIVYGYLTLSLTTLFLDEVVTVDGRRAGPQLRVEPGALPVARARRLPGPGRGRPCCGRADRRRPADHLPPRSSRSRARPSRAAWPTSSTATTRSSPRRRSPMTPPQPTDPGGFATGPGRAGGRDRPRPGAGPRRLGRLLGRPGRGRVRHRRTGRSGADDPPSLAPGAQGPPLRRPVVDAEPVVLRPAPGLPGLVDGSCTPSAGPPTSTSGRPRRQPSRSA